MISYKGLVTVCLFDFSPYSYCFFIVKNELNRLNILIYAGQCREDASFNLGLGCSLLYLIAASKNELTKMVELRKEVEMLLQNVKVELQRKDALCKPFESNDTIAYSTTDIQEGSNSNSKISLQSQTTSHVLQDSESIMVHDQLLINNHHQKEEHVEGMDELEAELVAELELLQIHLDRENLTKHPQKQRLKVFGITFLFLSLICN